MKTLITHLVEWQEDWKSHAQQNPTTFLSDMEDILDSSFFEGIESELDGIRDYLEQLRADVESKIKPKFGVGQLHKLINLVKITELQGSYHRGGRMQETLFLNGDHKIRPPVNTHSSYDGDTFSINEVEALLGGTVLNTEAVLELLKKL